MELSTIEKLKPRRGDSCPKTLLWERAYYMFED